METKTEAIEPDSAPSDGMIRDLLRQAFRYALPDRSDAAESLRLDSTLDELGIESIAALEMTGFIEEKLDVQFQDSAIGAVRGMNDLAELIRKHGGSWLPRAGNPERKG
jgi:acyl carrier protein